MIYFILFYSTRINCPYVHILVENMFEARIAPGSILKLIIEALKEVVTDANFECHETEMTLQVGLLIWFSLIGYGFFSRLLGDLEFT